jgi:hypothetical protein
MKKNENKKLNIAVSFEGKRTASYIRDYGLKDKMNDT